MPIPEKTHIISDFTPGIVSYVNGLSAGQRLGSGIAQEANTYRCIGLPGGGLAPLPTYSTVTVPTPGGTTFMDTVRVIGLDTIGRVYATSNEKADPEGDEVHIGLEWGLQPSPNNIRFAWYAIRAQDGIATLLTTVNTTTPAGTSGTFVPTPFFTARTRLKSTTSPANMSICGSWEDGTGSNPLTWFYPNPANPSSSAPIVVGGSHSGPIFAHEGRIIQLDYRLEPHGPSFSQLNQFLNFTVPPLGILFGDQGAIVEPSLGSIGAYTSLGQQGMLLIGVSDGAVVAVGDISDPVQASFQQSVQGTGGTIQKALVTPVGVIYTDGNSVYIWDGQTSTNLSRQLKAGFFLPTEQQPRLFNQTYITSALWLDYIVFPRNYLYDTITKSWWRLENPVSGDFDLVCQGRTKRSRLWAISNRFVPSATDQLKLFKIDTLASSYSWQSHPIPVSDRKWIDIREIEIVAIAPGGSNPTVSVTLSALDGITLVTETFNIVQADQPMRLRKPTSVQGYNIILRIQANSGSVGAAAPTVHSVTLGYHDTHTSGQSY